MVAVSIKTTKLTASVLQAAIKQVLAKMKAQRGKQPRGKQTLKQLMKQNTGVSNIEITDSNIKAFDRYGEEIRHRLCAEKGRNRKPAPLSCIFQRARC